MFEQAKSKLSKEKAKVFIQYLDAQSEDRLFLNALRLQYGKKFSISSMAAVMTVTLFTITFMNWS